MSNQNTNTAEQMTSQESLENRPKELSKKVPVVERFNGTFEFAYKGDRMLKVRPFESEDRADILKRVGKVGLATDVDKAGSEAEKLAKAKSQEEVGEVDNSLRESTTSSSERVKGMFDLQNFFSEMSKSYQVMGGRFSTPKMWMVEGSDLKNLLWRDNADFATQTRDTVNSTADPASSEVNYGLVLSEADMAKAKQIFDNNGQPYQDSQFDAEGFQAEIGGVRFLFLSQDMDKMNAMAMMSDQDKVADDNIEEENNETSEDENDGKEGQDLDIGKAA